MSGGDANEWGDSLRCVYLAVISTTENVYNNSEIIKVGEEHIWGQGTDQNVDFFI